MTSQNTAAHTPGPWRLRMHPADPELECPESPDAIVDTKNHKVVFACITLTTSREGEWLANTRLTAAAPDLLAALKMLREIDDAYGFDLNEQQRDQMHDAIAKAEGRS